jgi:transcriptional regulator of acetoin/glycerol metabolism
VSRSSSAAVSLASPKTLGHSEKFTPNLLESISQTMSRRFSLSDQAIEQLKQHRYPGNVCELRNPPLIAR